MEALATIVLALFILVAIKALIGFHFPWEPAVKAQKKLEANLGPAIYNAMYHKETNQARADAAEAAVRELLVGCY